MRPKCIRLNDRFFSANAGDILYLHESAGTYPEVCDECGRKRKCALYMFFGRNEINTTFMDVCRECSEKLGVADPRM